MTKYAIQVENLGKEYIIGAAEQRHDSFREMLTGALTSPLRKLRKLGGTASDIERFWALKDVSFNVEQGEVLGIIGRNGAGKSTLLKILSRITSPTQGRVVTRGRMASLLEVGTGFHPELTGRENIFLNGSILGMSKNRIQLKLDEIVDFADINIFLDTPVKRYSSGMYVRLAFSVAAHLEPDVLLIDEVLAVGDSNFQNKCIGKMGEVARDGRTVIFVSHNLSMVQTLCSKAVLLDRGLVIANGGVQEVIGDYLSGHKGTDRQASPWREDRPGNGWIRVTEVSVSMGGLDAGILQTGKSATIRIAYALRRQLDSAGFQIDIKTAFGEPVAALSNDYSGEVVNVDPAIGLVACSIDALPLIPGRYSISVICGARGELSDVVYDALLFDVVEGDFFGGGKLPQKGSGHVLIQHHWTSGSGSE